jgi:hypothetical protein
VTLLRAIVAVFSAWCVLAVACVFPMLSAGAAPAPGKAAALVSVGLDLATPSLTGAAEPEGDELRIVDVGSPPPWFHAARRQIRAGDEPMRGRPTFLPAARVLSLVRSIELRL